jgi:hypothetical protein
MEQDERPELARGAGTRSSLNHLACDTRPYISAVSMALPSSCSKPDSHRFALVSIASLENASIVIGGHVLH